MAIKKPNRKKEGHMAFTDPFQMCELFPTAGDLKKKKHLNRHHFKLTTEIPAMPYLSNNMTNLLYFYLHSRISTHIQ
jgi:hypothetical protein